MRSCESGGMVRRLIRMFKGEHPPEALQAAASKDAPQAGCVQAIHTLLLLLCTPLGLPDNQAPHKAVSLQYCNPRMLLARAMETCEVGSSGSLFVDCLKRQQHGEGGLLWKRWGL